jgi:hypothetical protein
MFMLGLDHFKMLSYGVSAMLKLGRLALPREVALLLVKSLMYPPFFFMLLDILKVC